MSRWNTIAQGTAMAGIVVSAMAVPPMGQQQPATGALGGPEPKPLITVIDFGPEFGAPVEGFAVLSGQLQGFGVLAGSTDPLGVYWFGDGGNSAYPYTIHAGALAGVQGPGGLEPIRFDFLAPVRRVTLRGLDGGGNVDTMILQAFDQWGHQVDEDESTGNFAAPGEVLEVHGDIACVVARTVSPYAGLFYDDLTIEWGSSPCEGTGDCNGNQIADSCEVRILDMLLGHPAPNWLAGISLGDRIVAQRFMAEPGGMMTGLRFRYLQIFDGAELGPSIEWSLHAESGNAPGGIVAQGTTSDLALRVMGQAPSGARWFEATVGLGEAVHLAPGAPYWIALHAPQAVSGDLISWAAAAEPAPASATTWRTTSGPWHAISAGGLSFEIVEAAHDCNANGVPDECEMLCDADVDGDGIVNFADVMTVMSAWGACACRADVDGDGDVDFADVMAIIAAWGPC